MSAPASSFRAVTAALVANSLVTVAKFVGFALSGSGAMLSEAIHSAADAGNQALLLIGLKRASREGSEEYPYGFGPERFVFGLFSAAGIFFVGCGVTVYHGVSALLHPHAPEFGLATAAVLAFSFALEGYSTYVAVAVVLEAKGDKPFFAYLFKEAEPATLAIVLEDIAALLGLLLATVGIGLAHFTGNPVWDALGSLVVGLLLGVIAIHLAVENRGLLLGKAVPREVADRFRLLVEQTPGVRAVRDVKTRQITPESYKFKADFALDEGYLAMRLGRALPASMPDEAARQRALACLAETAVGAISDLVDQIEARVRREIPEAQHIDLEVDHTEERRSKAAGETG